VNNSHACVMREFLRCVQAIDQGVAIRAKCGDGAEQGAEEDGGKRIEFNSPGETDERNRQAKMALDRTSHRKEKGIDRQDAESCASCGDKRRFEKKEHEYLARVQSDRPQDSDLSAAFVQGCV